MTNVRSTAWAALAATALLGACAAVPTAVPAAGRQSILQSSSPGAGTSVGGPVDRLELRFSPPARLTEVTVTGSDGLQMPVMVTAIGEVAYYSIPLHGLEAGSYTVQWRASAAGSEHRGSFGFTVR